VGLLPKLNSLWREYDSMVQLPVCICEGVASYKDHAQLLKLMQFVIGLDDVYALIMSTLLTINPLPTIKEAFSLLSMDESHRNIHSGSSRVKASSSAFMTKCDNKESTSAFAAKYVDNRKRFNNNNNNIVRNPILVCKHCNMNGHTIERLLIPSAGVSHSLTIDQLFLGDFLPDRDLGWNCSPAPVNAVALPLQRTLARTPSPTQGGNRGLHEHLLGDYTGTLTGFEDRTVASGSESHRQDRVDFEKVKEFMTSQFGYHS
ncbi:hypothetical protein Tco_0854918, partial [Tanacetum coccineum]